MAIIYIGKTVGPLKTRVWRHMYEAKNNLAKARRCQWVKGLIRRGLSPEAIILEKCSGDGCKQEIDHIAAARASGVRLVNHHRGGNGCKPGINSAITKVDEKDRQNSQLDSPRTSRLIY